METVSWPDNISVKTLLAKLAFLLCCFVQFCYVICSICRGSVLVVFLDVVLLFRCYAGVFLFRFSVIFSLFHQQCSKNAPVFWCSVNIPPLIRCAAGVTFSGVPGFIVCLFYPGTISTNNLGSFCTMLAREFIYGLLGQQWTETDIDWSTLKRGVSHSKWGVGTYELYP